MYQILQACARRGAFKPDEFQDVGGFAKNKSDYYYANYLEDQKKKKHQMKTLIYLLKQKHHQKNKPRIIVESSD